MKYFVAILLAAIGVTSSAYADENSISIGPTPTIQHASPALQKSLHMLRTRVESDAQSCIENAQGMESPGNYKASLRKTIETKKIVVVEVSGTMICDGVHPSTYRYGVAFEKSTGHRFDLNRIYHVAVRQDDHLFLRSELVEPVKTSYRIANANNQSCLARTDWVEGLTNLPMTFSPEPDGSLALYYSVADVSAACFPVLRIDRREVARYRDSTQAIQYGLP